MAHYGLLLIIVTTTVWWHVTTILPGAPPLLWVTRILHGQWFTCEAPGLVSMWSPLTCCGWDLTRVIWGQSLSSELILGSKTVINCTWARGGAAVVRGDGGVFYDHSGLGSDHPWPWWHRDNGSHGDIDPWSSQCYDVSTPRSWEEHRAWEASNEWEWEKKLWDGKKIDFEVCTWTSGAEKIS